MMPYFEGNLGDGLTLHLLGNKADAGRFINLDLSSTLTTENIMAATY